MQFGLCGAGRKFQRFMDSIFRDLDFYIDDILGAFRSAEEHEKHLQQVFERVHSHGFLINTDKRVFGATEIEFLGHLVNAQGICTLPEKVKAVLEFPEPETVYD